MIGINNILKILIILIILINFLKYIFQLNRMGKPKILIKNLYEILQVTLKHLKDSQKNLIVLDGQIMAGLL